MEKKLEEDMENEKGFEDEKFNRKKEKMINELREQYSCFYSTRFLPS